VPSAVDVRVGHGGRETLQIRGQRMTENRWVLVEAPEFVPIDRVKTRTRGRCLRTFFFVFEGKMLCSTNLCEKSLPRRCPSLAGAASFEPAIATGLKAQNHDQGDDGPGSRSGARRGPEVKVPFRGRPI